MQELLNNIDKIHTTYLGIERIKNNLKLNNQDPIDYCIKIVKDNKSIIEKKGKNWYIKSNNIIITINSYSYTIITARLTGK